jgi:hypothetical protein
LFKNPNQVIKKLKELGIWDLINGWKKI